VGCQQQQQQPAGQRRECLSDQHLPLQVQLQLLPPVSGSTGSIRGRGGTGSSGGGSTGSIGGVAALAAVVVPPGAQAVLAQVAAAAVVVVVVAAAVVVVVVVVDEATLEADGLGLRVLHAPQISPLAAPVLLAVWRARRCRSVQGPTAWVLCIPGVNRAKLGTHGLIGQANPRVHSVVLSDCKSGVCVCVWAGGGGNQVRLAKVCTCGNGGGGGEGEIQLRVS